MKKLAPEDLKTVLRIVEDGCYNCNKLMKMALVMQSMVIRDVSQFSEELIKIARDSGVKIEERHSKTMDLSYTANICPHCDVMIGMNFTYRYIYSYVVKDMEIDNDLLIHITEEKILII